MLLEVIIRAVGNAPQLSPPKRKTVFDICRCIAVVRQLILRMITKPDMLFLHIQRKQPIPAEVAPILEPFHVLTRLAKELQFHLLEFPRPEGEVSRRDLVAEAFADLPDTEWEPLAHRALDIFEIDENPLRRLRTQINFVSR